MTALLSSFALAIASAIVPWINGEIVLLAFIARATTPGDIVRIVAMVTAGQVVGKSVLFWLARRGRTSVSSPRVTRTIDRWRRRTAERPLAMLGTLFLSATVGVPPLFVTTLTAGALMIEFRTFFPVLVVGRLLHFGTVAIAPGLLVNALR